MGLFLGMENYQDPSQRFVLELVKYVHISGSSISLLGWTPANKTWRSSMSLAKLVFVVYNVVMHGV